MSKRITYADAVALLGGSSPAVAAFDRVLGGALLAGGMGGVATALDLFDAKSEFVRVGQSVLNGLNDRLRGMARLDRAQRLRAAHAVIVVTAFFEAADLVRLPFRPADLQLTRRDQLRLLDGSAAEHGWLGDLLAAELPQPAPECPYESTVEQVRELYVSLSGRYLSYLDGLAVWERLNDNARARASALLREELPRQAVGRYEILYRKLAVEVPEFGWWAWQSDSQATRAELRHGLRRLEELLLTITCGQAGHEPKAQRAGRGISGRAARADHAPPGR